MYVLLFGTYDAAAHPRVAVLRDGLREHGVDVVECNAPLGLATAQRVAILRQPWRLPVLAWRLARCWSSLARQARSLDRPQAVVVGYLGHFDVHLARRLFRGIPVVLDHLVSGAATAHDRGASGSVLQAALRWLDRRALAAADVVVVDTEEHRADLPVSARAKAVVVPVGATVAWFDAAAQHRPQPEGPLRAVFFGLFTPLQGAVTIAEAARLAGPSVHLTMAGHGQDSAAARAAAGDADVMWLDWVPPDELPALVARHDVCLGIMGTTPKAQRVVPTKVFQGAAAGCAVVTSDTAPQRRAVHGDATLVPPGDPALLAETLEHLAADRDHLARLREAAARRARTDFTPRAVVAPLAERLAGGITTAAPLPPLTATATLRWAAMQPLLPEHAHDVVDVGAGQGAIGSRLAARYPRYLGLEPDPESAAVARSRVAPHGGEVRTATTLDLAGDERFDLLCAFEVLEHLDDDSGALREWLTHLRPGGSVVFSVPAYQHRFGPSDTLVGHVRRYSPEALRELLEGAGLCDVDVRHYAFPIGYPLEAVRHRVAARTLAAGAAGRSEAERTAASGRTFQPRSRLSGLAYRAAVLPSLAVQARFPGRGTSLVAGGRLPD